MPTKKGSRRAPPELPVLPDYAVLTKAQAIAATGLSEDTFDRIRAQGLGPPHIFLSARRIGFPVGKFRAWQEQRSAETAA